MRAKAVLAGALLMHCISASRNPPLPLESAPAGSHRTEGEIGEKTELRLLLDDGVRLFSERRYSEAGRVFQAGHEKSVAAREPFYAVRFLTNIGSCRFATFQYRSAIQAYLEAREQAERAQDHDLAIAMAINVSALYLQFGELDAAFEAARRGLATMRRHGPTKHGPKLLIQTAALHASQGGMAAAEALLYQAIKEADRQADAATQAFAWDQLGYERMQRGDLERADLALVEAFRLRRVAKLPELYYSYYTLGTLRVEQGNALSASRLLQQAVDMAGGLPGALPLWRVYYQRGRANMLAGQLERALEDFQRALDIARQWRVEVLPADSVRTGAEAGLHQLYSSYIAAASRLYWITGDDRLARRVFEAAEENRAVSLRALLNLREEWLRTLPAAYWESLAQLRAAEADLLQQESPRTRESIQALRSRVTEMETGAGAELPMDSFRMADAGGLLDKVRERLRPEEAFFSFHLGDTHSLLSVLTREGLDLYRLPARPVLVNQVKQFREAIRASGPEAPVLGERLYEQLFGRLRGDAAQKRHWIMALDDVLFEMPLAALVIERDLDRPVFLVERRSLRVVPAAAMIADGEPGGVRDGPFLGVGDPIYNTADPRWKEHPRARLAGGGSFMAFAPPLVAEVRERRGLELARLAGSGREIAMCARTWDPEARVLLLGADASRLRLMEALEGGPAVVHFATHFLPSPEASRQALIALSLEPSGEMQFLSPTEILRWRLRLGLVVLSGCSSGQAAALPGAGLMGMTRAWLAAGAGAVAASLWPTPDDSGELFISFYRHLPNTGSEVPGRNAAAALRDAQIEMLRSDSWRSLPRYWAAYFVVAKE